MKKIVTLATCLLLGASLNANDAKGVYVGVGVGPSQFDDGGLKDDDNAYLTRTAQTYRAADSYDATGYKIYAGYQFNKIIAVEASYTGYGEQSLDYSNGDQAKVSLTSIGIAANVGYNFGKKDEFRPFVIIGVSSVNFNKSGSLNYYSDSSTAAYKLGVGFEYAPSIFKGLGFRIAYEGDYYSVKSNATAPEFKSEYTQGDAMYYFGVQYKF